MRRQRHQWVLPQHPLELLALLFEDYYKQYTEDEMPIRLCRMACMSIPLEAGPERPTRRTAELPISVRTCHCFLFKTISGLW